jgi:hypothetical protein
MNRITLQACGNGDSENGSHHEIEDLSSRTETLTHADEKGNDKNYFSDMFNEISNIFNLPWEMGSSHSSSFDDDDTTNTNYTSDYENSQLSSSFGRKYTQNESLTRNKKNQDTSKTPLLCYSDVYSSSFDSEDTRRQDSLNDDESDEKENNSHYYDYESPMAQLYKAIDTKNWEMAYRWLKAKPNLASKWVYRKDKSSGKTLWVFLPLHAACFSGTPASLIKLIIHAYPKGLDIPAYGGKFPLHIACETGACDDVINCIARGLPSAINRRDNNGNTPLQLCEKSMKGRQQKRITKMLKGIAGGKESRFMTTGVRHIQSLP